MSKLLKNFKKRKKNEKGFTLVELIVVIVILAILIGVSIGGLYSWVGKSRNNTDINNAASIQGSLSSLAADKDVYTWANGSPTPSAITIQWSDTATYDSAEGQKTYKSATVSNCKVSDKKFCEKINTILTDGLPAPKAAKHFTIKIDPNGGNPKVTCKAYSTPIDGNEDTEHELSGQS